MDIQAIWLLSSIGFITLCVSAGIKIALSPTISNDYENIGVSDTLGAATKKNSIIVLAFIWIALLASGFALQIPENIGALMMLALSPIFYLAAIYSKLRSGMIKGFAQENSLRYSPWESVPSSLPPHLNLGHSRKITDIVSGIYNGNNIKFFNFTYTTGSGKNQSTHTFAVCELDCPSKTPHIDLEPRGWNLAPGAYDNFGLETLRLEGEFGDRYNFFVPKGFERQVLEVFTPDIMEEFLNITGNKSLNFEFYNGKIIVSINWQLNNKKELRWMLAVSQWLQNKIIPKLEKIA